MQADGDGAIREVFDRFLNKRGTEFPFTELSVETSGCPVGKLFTRI